MFTRLLIVAAVCLMTGAHSWAQTYHVLDTGDPDERVCNPRSYTDLGNGIVRDTVTGLEWVKDGNLIASRDPSFDNDGDTGDGNVTWQHALDYVELLNDAEYLGYDDWRLPSINELSSLVDVSRNDPTIEIHFFPDTEVASAYWSSTAYVMYPTSAWVVYFGGGGVDGEAHDSRNHVRAVRGGPYEAGASFAINGDATVTDTTTGLMWQQCNYGQTWDGDTCTGTAIGLYWDEAAAYVQALNDDRFLGYDDWRLPTRTELQSVIDYRVYDPATTFPDTLSSDIVPCWYWSSTGRAEDPGFRWFMNFYYGSLALDNTSHGHSSYVRAVRGGVCAFTCELSIKHKPIYSAKLTKPRKVVLHITGGEEFAVFGRIDLGPLTWKNVSFNSRKKRLTITAFAPAGLAPGIISVFVGDCVGGVEIQ